MRVYDDVLNCLPFAFYKPIYDHECVQIVFPMLRQTSAVLVLLSYEVILTASSMWYFPVLYNKWGTRWHSWLRDCAISWKFAGSIPYGVTGIFHWHNRFGCTMALGLTQPLTEMSTSRISWGVKAAIVWGWQPYHLNVPTLLKSGNLILLEPSGPVHACNGIALLYNQYFSSSWWLEVIVALLASVHSTSVLELRDKRLLVEVVASVMLSVVAPEPTQFFFCVGRSAYCVWCNNASVPMF
jgi:hypothetical protein